LAQRLKERGKAGKGRMVDGRPCGPCGLRACRVRVGGRLAAVWARVSLQNENRRSGWSAECRFTNHNYKWVVFGFGLQGDFFFLSLKKKKKGSELC
jgi:hypothetical protein